MEIGFSGTSWDLLGQVLAERVGFEPTIRYQRIHAFQACALSRSAISPRESAILARRTKKARLAGGLTALIGCRALSLGLLRVPDTDMARFRHQEQAKHEAHRGHRNRVDQRVAEVVSRLEGRRGDQRH